MVDTTHGSPAKGTQKGNTKYTNIKKGEIKSYNDDVKPQAKVYKGWQWRGMPIL